MQFRRMANLLEVFRVGDGLSPFPVRPPVTDAEALAARVQSAGAVDPRRWTGPRSAGEAWPAVLLAWPAAGYDLREQLLSGGNDLAVTADLMGHARTDTTRLYDRRGEDAKRAAMDTLPVPYVKPASENMGSPATRAADPRARRPLPPDLPRFRVTLSPSVPEIAPFCGSGADPDRF